ncbi:MAG: beta-galactosidase [Clostridia bacterium]|nr:beta-galactosidase [Clostridia bacterium]
MDNTEKKADREPGSCGQIVDLRQFTPQSRTDLGEDFSGQGPRGAISFNSFYMEMDGKPFFPVSGEFHYSRMDERRWERELIKMRQGGVNVVSTYIFWNHLEEEEGVFDFSGRRNLRKFVELCAEQGLYVILRIGPFAHGEVRNGGLPDWLYGKPFEVRTTQQGFLDAVRRLYREIAQQVQGQFFKDGGPIIGVQLDNEYMHSSAPWEMTTGISDEWVFPGDEGEQYLLSLRDLALSEGMTPAFFTGTAWGGAAYSEKVLPLWGGYAYRPWIFYSHRGEHPATEEYVYEDYHHRDRTWADDFAPAYDPESRPYACCEMGGGMMCSYYYRFVFPCRSVDALANIKLGSGCNFLGYYMFHGGTNPLGKHGQYLNESQVPKRSYDYQAALGEFGQTRESYARLRTIHYFLRFFGDRLAQMETVLPEGASRIDPRDTQTVRWAVRSDGQSGFLFVNNFQDHVKMDAIRDRVVSVVGRDGQEVSFKLSLSPDENAILPFHFDMDGIMLRRASAQPVLRTVIHGRITYVFMIPDGMDGMLDVEEGVSIEEEKGRAQDTARVTYRKGERLVDVICMPRWRADTLYLLRDGSLILTEAALLEEMDGRIHLESQRAEEKIYTYPPERLARSTSFQREADEGIFGVYTARVPEKVIPVDAKRTANGRWTLSLPQDALDGVRDVILKIDYEGDIGKLFLGNEMIHDNFCNGATWEFGLMEYGDRLSDALTLTISPLRAGAKVQTETAMAARSEQVESALAELRGVRACPVYEMELERGGSTHEGKGV